nr:reverse transcriptase domain-containing protein [Tanacetum cinerariifolium]
PKWEGPYEVTEALGKGAYKLRDHYGKPLSRTRNVCNLKNVTYMKWLSYPLSFTWLASLFPYTRSRLISKASSFCTMSIFAVHKVGMPISAGMIVSILYVSKNGVSPLLDLIMVRCAHRTCGISLIESLIPLSSRTFIPSPRLLFALSIKPLACRLDSSMCLLPPPQLLILPLPL